MEINRNTRKNLKDLLIDRPYEFKLHQALYLLRQLGTNNISFKSNVTFAHTYSDIKKIDISNNSAEIHANPLSLAGANGPLPSIYTELIMSRSNKNDNGIKDFLDIFNNRLLQLFYVLESKYHPAIDVKKKEKTKIGKTLTNISGWKENSNIVPQKAMISLAQIYWQQSHNKTGLSILIKTIFGFETKIFQFIGNWIHLPDIYRTKLCHAELGKTALGRKTWSNSAAIEIQLKLLTLESLLSFCPKSKNFESLKNATFSYISPETSFKISFIIYLPAKHASTLGQNSFLGITSWLYNKKSDRKHIRINTIFSALK